MPPTKAALKVAPSGGRVVTPIPPKPSSPKTHVTTGPSIMTSTSTTSLKDISNPHELTAFVRFTLRYMTCLNFSATSNDRWKPYLNSWRKSSMRRQPRSLTEVCSFVCICRMTVHDTNTTQCRRCRPVSIL